MKTKERIKIEITYLANNLRIKIHQHSSLLLYLIERLSTSQDKIFQAKDISTKLRNLNLEIDELARKMIGNEKIEITYLSENLLLKIKEYKKLSIELIEQLITSQDRIPQGKEMFAELRNLKPEIDNFFSQIKALNWVIQD